MDMIHDDPSMNYSDRDVFTNDFVKHNLPFYNFIHHLLFAGWADNDCYTSPGSGSPFRGQLLGDGKDYNDWNGGHRDFFGEMYECFMCLHKSDEEKSVPPQSMLVGEWERPQYTLSQIQYIPETIVESLQTVLITRQKLCLVSTLPPALTSTVS